MPIRKVALIILFVILLIFSGGVYFIYGYFKAFAPTDVAITEKYISSNHGFINGVTIEKIRVDSIGAKGYPVKYATIYTTSCNIHYPANKPPDPPNRIEFNEPGNYSWNEDTVSVRYIQTGLSRQSLESTNRLWWLNKFGNYPVCPIRFDKEQWYFITIGDPQVTGIFFYINKSGEENHYFLPSGISPI
jgi:hypothetical protein